MTSEIKAEFKMFVPEDDGSAMDWLENTLTQDRAALHTSLVAAVEGRKYKEQVVGAGLLDSQINVNEGLDEALTIINSIFKE